MRRSDAEAMVAYFEEQASQARAQGRHGVATTCEEDAEFFRLQALAPSEPEPVSWRTLLTLGSACWLASAGLVALGVFIWSSVR